jgi:hypothetical protein
MKGWIYKTIKQISTASMIFATVTVSTEAHAWFGHWTIKVVCKLQEYFKCEGGGNVIQTNQGCWGAM